MKKKLIRSMLNPYTTTLTMAGGAIWSAGRVLPVSEHTSQALEHLGLAVGVTTVVATALNYSFESALRHSFSIVKGAEGASIHRIFAHRDDEALQRMIQATADVGRQIDLLCVAGTSFLHAESKFLGLIEHRRQLNSNVEVRVLLLDPRSRYAILRCLREELKAPGEIPKGFNYISRKLCSDILAAVRTVEDLQQHTPVSSKNESPHFHLKVRLYNAPPKLMYLRVDDRAFIEQYHDGIPSDQLSSALTKCLGKSVPVYETSSNSKQGKAYASFFQFLWDASEGREIRPGSYEELNQSLASRDWVDYHLGRLREEAELLDFDEGLEVALDENRIVTESA